VRVGAQSVVLLLFAVIVVSTRALQCTTVLVDCNRFERLVDISHMPTHVFLY
jgi:hypothetical protein